MGASEVTSVAEWWKVKVASDYPADVLFQVAVGGTSVTKGRVKEIGKQEYQSPVKEYVSYCLLQDFSRGSAPGPMQVPTDDPVGTSSPLKVQGAKPTPHPTLLPAPVHSSSEIRRASSVGETTNLSYSNNLCKKRKVSNYLMNSKKKR